MSLIFNINNAPLVNWKGQTFNQIYSTIQKNGKDSATNNLSLQSYFRARPLKIYRREIVSQPIERCNERISASIDILNRPSGTITNSTATTVNGIQSTVLSKNPNNSCETYTNCNIILSPAENAKRRVRSSGMIRPKYDSTRDTKSYFTDTKQYLENRNLSFNRNQYNYIRKGDASVKPGSSLSTGNEYSPNGLNSCKKYFISADTTFKYTWIDSIDYIVNIPSGYYYITEINDIFKRTMMQNYHYYARDQVGLNTSTYNNVHTFLLNISYNNIDNVVEIQSFRTDNTIHPESSYLISDNATWTRPTISIYPQIIIEDNIMKDAFGISPTTFPTNTSSTSNLYQVLHSDTISGLTPMYKNVYYKPNNPQFAAQGAVSASDLITRKRYNSITNSAVNYYNALGASVGNALAYGVPTNGYTIKDKIGYPLKQTPTFSKYTDEMMKCTDTKISG